MKQDHDKTNNFIEKARKTHGDRYDYSCVEYKKAHEKVGIICHKHGLFSQAPTNHLSGTGCPSCWEENRLASSQKKAKEAANTFIDKAKVVHGDKYDYSRVVYKNSKAPVKIICLEHGEFGQSPSSHLRGSGCNDCGIITSASAKRISFDEFLLKARDKHGDRYLYKETSFSATHDKMQIQCKEHGYFKQTPSNHLNGQGCKKCASIELGKNRNAKWTNELIDKFKEVHKDLYDYSDVNAVDSVTPVSVFCRRHGSFPVRPSNHLTGHGCPDCAKENSPQYIDARIKNDSEYANREGILYLLEVSHQLAEKTFYKIGITSLGGVDKRYGQRSIYSAFEFQQIDEVGGIMLNLWQAEKSIKRKIKKANLTVEPFCEDFWHWSESFYWEGRPTLQQLQYGCGDYLIGA